MLQLVSSVLSTCKLISCIVTCSQQSEPSSRPANRLSTAGLFLQLAAESKHGPKAWAQQSAVTRDTWASSWQWDPELNIRV